jgi:RNA polymerase sigma factor (sigma-70 family)
VARKVPEELDHFCRLEYRRVFGALVLITGSSDVAAELAQEAFIRVCRDWEKVAAMDAPGAWAHRVAVNLALGRRRRQRAERRAIDRLAARRPAAPPSELPPGSDVREALLTLDEPERIVIALRFFADKSVEDVALALDIPEGTVKSRTRRGLAALRATGCFEDELIDE